jgi:hypothetical protein
MRTQVRSVLLLAALTLPAVVRGQGVIVQSVSDVRLTGALGTAANLAAKLGGGSMHNIENTMYVSGHRMRSENANTGSIIDADAGRITSIDHKQKTYTSMTFAEMAAAMQQAVQGAKQESAKEKAKNPKASDDSVKLKYKVAVDRPGQREKVLGYDAERVFITITIEAEVNSEGKDQAAGNMVFLIDELISKDAPQIAALREFQRAYAQKAGQEFRSQTVGLQGVMAADPRMKTGFEAAAKELAKVPGIALKTATYAVVVPAGLEFDRKIALGDGAVAAAEAEKEKAAPKDEKKSGGGFRGMMGSIKSAAEAAAKQSEKQNEKGADKTPPKQMTLMTITDDVKSITKGDVSADQFVPPAGYREIKRN